MFLRIMISVMVKSNAKHTELQELILKKSNRVESYEIARGEAQI